MDKNKMLNLLNQIENDCNSMMSAELIVRLTKIAVVELKKELNKPEPGLPESVMNRIKLDRQTPRI